MAISGRVTNGWLPRADYSKAELVLVTGAIPNICGHVLLCFDSVHYFHFDGPNVVDYPRYLSQVDYIHYLRVTKKRELLRHKLPLPCPQSAMNKLSELMSRKWGTFLISHNCASFIALVVHAGGNFWDLPQHCPTVDTLLSKFSDKAFGPSRRAQRLSREAKAACSQ